MPQRFGSAAALALVLGLLSSSNPSAQGQPDCTITVQPGQSIQQAIDAAPEGAVICLSTGYFFESLVIKKGLTLRGILYPGLPTSSHLRNFRDERAVISIQSDSQVTVLIENISIVADASEKLGVVGIYATGQVRAILRNVEIRGIANSAYPDISWAPLTADGSAQVEVIGSIIEGDSYGLGIWFQQSAHLSVENSTVSGYRQGVTVTMHARVMVVNSIISRNGVGIAGWDWSQIDIQQTSIIGNVFGLRIGSKGKFTIFQSRVMGNEWNGLFISGTAEVEIKASTVVGNGTHPRCWEPDAAGWWEGKICNGIELAEEAQLVVSDSTIVSNADWAITVPHEKCGYIPNQFNVFRGKVSFLGKNKIEGNNQSGNQNGMGNPGNHPWNRPDVPDGQVCLP